MARSQIQEGCGDYLWGLQAVLPLPALMSLVSPLGPKFIHFRFREGLCGLQVRFFDVTPVLWEMVNSKILCGPTKLLDS